MQKKTRAGAPNTLFLLSGDFISPSVASRLFKGKQMVAALNAAGLDIATLGNHEFDFGPDVLRERMKESRFSYTIANVSNKKSNLGNFLADVYKQAVGADSALVNSGGIRSDATYGPGDLTKKDILSILPFENTLVKVRLTGAHLKRLLENGVSVAGEEDGRFPQVSGISFTYDGRLPVGSRVTSIEVGGKPMETDRSYTIAVNAYILGGGDGYDFKGGEVLITPEDGPVEPDVVMEAIRKFGTIAPQVEGRIKSAQANQKSMLFPVRRFASAALRGGVPVGAR